MLRWLSILSIVTLLGCFVVPIADAQTAFLLEDVREDSPSLERLAKDYLASHTEARLAQAKEMVLVIPHWEHGEGAHTDLFLLNNFREPLDAELTVLDTDGRVVWIEVLTVEPASHLEIPLSRLVNTSAGAPRGGSARLRYSGDPDMLQAWGVLQGRGGAIEIGSKNLSVSTETRLTSFWDTRPFNVPGGLDLEYSLVNGSDQAIPFQVSSRGPDHGSAGSRTLEAGVLAPGERRTWAPSGRRRDRSSNR